jgi:ribosomal protein S18 acetylase RimI-like enzyme
VIRPLSAADAAAFVELRREALQNAPFAFGSSPSDDRARSLDFVHNALADPQQRIFGAFVPGLVGAVGVYRELTVKSMHKAHLWGLYMSGAYRRRGFGTLLVEAAVAFARSLDGVGQVQLSVSAAAPEAAALYKKVGFVTWGLEPGALRIHGADVAEQHMQLKFTDDAA